MIYLKSFVIGGLICAITQVFMEKTKLMPGRIMVLLVIAGVLMGAIGVYEPLLEFAGSGAGVPLTGFGYQLYKGVREAVEYQGFVGLFKGGFKAASVGCSAAIIFSYVASLLAKPKMTK